MTKKVINYSNAPGQYDEPEGIFPDGEYTLVECDKQNLKGAGHVDLWKLQLDGSGAYERLTLLQRLSRLQGVEPGRERRRPVHRLSAGQVERGRGRRPRHLRLRRGEGTGGSMNSLV